MARRGHRGARALAILRTLEACPWLPAEVLAVLVGTPGRDSVARPLQRLRGAGLVVWRRVELGPLVGGARPLTLWSSTPPGAPLPPAVATPFAGSGQRRRRRHAGRGLARAGCACGQARRSDGA